jgi:hypothetical protein
LTPAIQVCSSTWSITIATASDAGALNVCISIYFTLHPSHPPDLQAVSERKKKPLTPHNAGRRRHSDAELQPCAMRNNPHLRSAFKRAATITRVVVRLKSLVAKKPKSVRNAYGPPTPRPRCGSCFCIYELLSSPLVVRRFFLVAKLPVDQSSHRCRSPSQHALSTRTRGKTAKEKAKE